MGGVAGHMDHLYDNPELTFGKMKDILRAAANAELEAEEKVDGQNLFLSYSMKDDDYIYVPEDEMNKRSRSGGRGKARGARNKGNLKAGGLDASGLATKFAGRGGLTQAFTGGFAAFEKAVEALSDEEKVKVFGPDANIWYNAEIMDPGTEGDPSDPGSVNVIKYDNKTLKIHGVGHFLWDKETQEKKPVPYDSLQIIDNNLEKMQQQLANNPFNLARKAIIQLKKLEDEEVLIKTIAKINQEMSQNQLNDNSTMSDYMYARLYKGLDTDLPETTKDGIVKYLLKLPGNVGLRALKKGLNPEDLQDLNQVIAAKKMLLVQAIQPLELAIHDFAVELLKGLDSVFIADTNTEVARLRDELSKAVRAITATGAEDPHAMEVMQRHLNKIKDFSQVTTPVEAVVFDYDGHTYKFSGNFAPLNQILGMFKFSDRAAVPPSNETNESILQQVNVIKEEEEKITSEPSKAERFVLSLPKFTPTEAWGDPNSMERQQIQRIFDTVGGGATIQEKLQFLNDSIENPRGGIRSPRRIISTLILLESIRAVIESFGEAPAGFVFEGFMAGLLRGEQVAGRTEKGNLPIQDLIAFSELGGGKSVPVSLKLLKGLGPNPKKGEKVTPIEGSYTNLVDALEEFGLMVYIVGRKDGEKIVLEKFTFTRDNFIDALITGGKGGLVKEADLFVLPEMDRKESLDVLRATSDWPTLYELLQQTAGYNPAERARKLSKKDKDEKVAITDEVPDGEDVEVDVEEVEATPAANRKESQYSVAECRKLWSELMNESLLLESSGGRQWSISPAQLKRIAPMVDYETLGSLPYNSDKIVKVAEQYMKFLSDNLLNVFEATKDLSENITQYFTFRQRDKAISSGEKAIQDSNTISTEMAQQITQDKGMKESVVHEVAYTQGLTNTGEATGKKIALFPGKFKPPHRGHYEFAKKMAKKLGNDGEVVVLISPSSKPEVNPQQSLKIWNKYLQSADAPDNIQVEIADYRSPITSVYEFVADPVKARAGDTVYLIKSSKDIGDTRYDGAQSYAERNNPGVNVELIEEDPVVRPDGEPYHGEDAREAISQNNRKMFNSFMPTKVDSDEVWNIFYPNDTLDNMIDEISSMAGGAVSGGGSGFGRPNTYNPYKRSKHGRPKVKRGKRQKRK
jgi:phosphopantetheine adenylyltransferase